MQYPLPDVRHSRGFGSSRTGAPRIGVACRPQDVGERVPCGWSSSDSWARHSGGAAVSRFGCGHKREAIADTAVGADAVEPPNI